MRAWTLMTAMPPTRGHMNLIDFVARMPDGEVPNVVVVCTQPDEPMWRQRVAAIREYVVAHNLFVEVKHLHRTLPQDPQGPGFWTMWERLMNGLGFKRGDIFCSSETYGAIMARQMGGHFMPFDPKRELHPARGTDVRLDPAKHFDYIMPEFQHNLITEVTVWGAESTGKTTLSKALANIMNGHWTYEWARPYLDLTGTVPVDLTAMVDIWKGQQAIQQMSNSWTGKPYIVRDTDLYSTIGYWEQPQWRERLGPVPSDLIFMANKLKSDLYLITTATIPFEVDPLRYGGDHRESPDEFWISVADKYGLNYRILDTPESVVRESWSMKYMNEASAEKYKQISFDRKGM